VAHPLPFIVFFGKGWGIARSATAFRWSGFDDGVEANFISGLERVLKKSALIEIQSLRG